MDFTKALTYPFDDPDWAKKLGIAAGIGLVAFILSSFLIGLLALVPLIGWSIETTKRVRNNEQYPMASWDDFGGLVQKGLTPFLAAIVYQIPTLLVYCVAFGVFLIPILGGNNDNAVAALGGVASIVFFCCICLVFVYAIAAGIVFWGGLMRYLDKEEFGTFMQFQENFALVQNNFSDFLMAYLFTFIGGAIASVVGGAIPCIGWAAVFPFTFYFNSHIMGQLAAKLAGAAPKPAM